MAAGQPRKPMTAFLMYCNEQRSMVKGLAMKTISEQWKGLSEDARAPYDKKAVVAKAKYDSSVETYKASGGVIARKSKKEKASKGAKKNKDKDAPKRPSGGGYGQYLAENRAELLKCLPKDCNPISDVAKWAAGRWYWLSEAQKLPYENKFAEKMKEFKAAMKAYRASKPAAGEVEDKEQNTPPSKGTKKSEDGDVRSSKRAKTEGKESPSNPAAEWGEGREEKTPSPGRAKKSRKVSASSGKRSSKAAMEAYKASKPAAGEGEDMEQREPSSKLIEESDECEARSSKRARKDYKTKSPSNPTAERSEDREEKTPSPKRAKKSEKPSAPSGQRASEEDNALSPEGKSVLPAAKRGCCGSKKMGPGTLEIDAGILAEAKKLGWEFQLCNLAGREDVKALGKKDEDLLAALSAANGLVHPARRALLCA